MDTACLELCCINGSMLAIDTIVVENVYAGTGLLAYNVPLEDHTGLMLNSDAMK